MKTKKVAVMGLAVALAMILSFVESQIPPLFPMIPGNIGLLWYSLAGAVLSLAGMIALKKTGLFSGIAVSVIGGVLHNVGQIAVACVLFETDKLLYYLPFLMISGTVAGIAIGLLAGILIKRIRVEG